MLDNYRKYKGIEDFLKKWAKIAASNPDMSFNNESMKNAIYNDLIHIGVNKEDTKINLRDTSSPLDFKTNIPYSREVYVDSAFNNWLEYYHNNNNIDVFVSPNWSYFCQFVSKDKSAYTAKEHIKVYIPLDSKHIENGAKLIFDFLTKNNITHLSKIGKNIRFDDIVVRLINPEDAEKLNNFIKNNKYINEGIIEANPFAFHNDKIAMACDGQLSYNDTVAGMIDMYIDKKRKENKLREVGFKDFYSFLINEYKEQFQEHKANNISRKFNIYDNNKLENYKNVIELMIKSQNPNFTYEHFINHYQRCAGINYISRAEIENTNKLIIEAIEAIEAITERFNSQEYGIANVESFVITGQTTLITRKNGLRDRLSNSNFREQVNKILKMNKVTFRQYLNEIYNRQTIIYNAKK